MSAIDDLVKRLRRAAETVQLRMMAPQQERALFEDAANSLERLETERTRLCVCGEQMLTHACPKELRRVTAERDALRATLAVAAPWVCPECGPHVRVDEDGCCATCGADVVRSGGG
jgi:rubrerythrin